MKSLFSTLSIVGAICIVLCMHGCEADVDINNIDTSVKVNAKIAAPIGSLRATLGDFVGNGTWGIIAENGILTFQDTFSIERKFHNIDISRHVSNASVKMDVYDQLDKSGLGMITNGEMYIPGTGIQVPLSFPLTLKLKGINDDVTHQRLDSILIENANFTSRISKSGGLPLEWEWIDKVTVDLNPQFFYRAEGNSITIYEKGAQGGYDQDMTVNIDNFSINLMKNRHPQGYQEYFDNVVDECELSITMYVTVPISAGMVRVPEGAGFQYNLGVKFIDYTAIWGMFEPSKDMSGGDEITIADEWSGWNDLKSLKVPFANPMVDLNITTQIAGALELTGDYLYVKDDNDQTVYASFNGSRKLYKSFNPEECLPLSSAIGESKTVTIPFNNTKEHGEIDKLFAVHPEKLGYKYSVNFNPYKTPQIRISNNTSISVDAVCKLPMVFNEGVAVDYSGTLSGLDLSMLDLDSLLAGVSVIDTLEGASATLALTFCNDLPFRVKGVFTCLDEKGDVIIDPKTNQPLRITGKDTVVIPAPEYTQDYALNWTPKPVEHLETIQVDRDDLETLRKVKSIAFYAALDDKSLSEVYRKGNFNAKLTESEGVRVKIGIGANVEAVLSLEFRD